MAKTYSEKQSRRTVAWATVTLALTAIAFVTKAALRAFGIDDGGWLALGYVIVGFALVFVLGFQFWKGMDEMQRRGYALSWYWGSVGGLAVTACIIIASGLAQSQFTLGVATLVVMQLVCSMLFYAF